jgi:hypothetical protein
MFIFNIHYFERKNMEALETIQAYTWTQIKVMHWSTLKNHVAFLYCNVLIQNLRFKLLFFKIVVSDKENGFWVIFF